MAQSTKKSIFSQLTASERKVLERLDTPAKVQDYLNSLKQNNGKKDTLYSPRMVIQKKTAHCVEGAIFAAAAFWYHGRKPLLLDLKALKPDAEHVVALFKEHGHWGAVSKTNHAVLRYREPVYKSVRELVMSYFHEYFLDNGKKTLRSYSEPFDLSLYEGDNWVISNRNLWYIADDLDHSKHFAIAPEKIMKHLRLAEKVEIKAGKILQQKP